MYILIGYIALSLLVGIYAKVMHSRSFWYYTLFSLGITPLGGWLFVLKTAPVRIWWKKNAPKSNPQKEQHSSVYIQKFEKPKYNSDYSSSRSTQNSRNNDNHYHNPVLSSGSCDVDSSPSSSDSCSSPSCD